MLHTVKLLALFLLLSLSACSELQPSATDNAGSTQHYLCDKNKTLTVTHNSAKEITLEYLNQAHRLTLMTAASGEKYQNEQYIWWAKGQKGLLLLQQPNQTDRIELRCKRVQQSHQ